MQWIKASERLPSKGDLYHTNIRWKDTDMSLFPSINNFYGDWEISETYEVIEWLDESPIPAEIGEQEGQILDAILSMSEDTGRFGCTYGDTDYDSLSAVYGYNTCLENIKSTIIKWRR